MEKQKKSCALFSCLGLGDGLLALVLAHNLSRNHHTIDLFHPFLKELETWFPFVTMKPINFSESFEFLFSNYQKFFFIYDRKMQKIIDACLDRFPKDTYVLNPIATPNCDYRYWEYGQFDGEKTFVDNLQAFCQHQLKLENATRLNGIKIPEEIVVRRFQKRVILHPLSSRPGKNWTKEKFLLLSQRLKDEGFDPVFILTREEKKEWPEVDSPDFDSLAKMATFVAESGWMIGNDSGIGHLASCIGLPTLTICRHQMVANFWRPAWSVGKLAVPPNWIPNLKGLRLRDHHWQRFVSVNKVCRSFLDLVEQVSG